MIFNGRPIGAGKEEMLTWEKVKRPSIALLDKYFNKAGVTENDKPLFHSGLNYFEDNGRCGTREKTSQLEHGLIRKVWPDGPIWEYSSMNGLMHGLQILYSSDLIDVWFV